MAVGGFSGAKAALSAAGPGAGVIEKEIRPGQFWARLDTGQRVLVHSAASLSAGQKVTVLPAPAAAAMTKAAPIPAAPDLGGSEGSFWTVLMPFDFGWGESTAKLEIFVEKNKKSASPQAGRASFLVFTTDFADGDRVQWSLYLKGKNVSLQVYSGDQTVRRHDIVGMSAEIEKKLRKMGFILAAPTIRLARPFKVPKGFGLNVRA